MRRSVGLLGKVLVYHVPYLRIGKVEVTETTVDKFWYDEAERYRSMRQGMYVNYLEDKHFVNPLWNMPKDDTIRLYSRRIGHADKCFVCAAVGGVLYWCWRYWNEPTAGANRFAPEEIRKTLGTPPYPEIHCTGIEFDEKLLLVTREEMVRFVSDGMDKLLLIVGPKEIGKSVTAMSIPRLLEKPGLIMNLSPHDMQSNALIVNRAFDGLLSACNVNHLSFPHDRWTSTADRMRYLNEALNGAVVVIDGDEGENDVTSAMRATAVDSVCQFKDSLPNTLVVFTTIWREPLDMANAGRGFKVKYC